MAVIWIYQKKTRPGLIGLGCAGYHGSSFHLRASAVQMNVFSAVFKKKPVPGTGLILWSGRRDLNSRPHAPEACALTGLRYVPISMNTDPVNRIRD
jgi:hypothetical protein